MYLYLYDHESTLLGTYFGVVFAIPLGIFVIWALVNIMVVRQKECVIVERWGKFYRKLDAGLYWLVPLVDRPQRVIWRETVIENDLIKIRQKHDYRLDMRQRVMDFVIQTIITRDNVEIGVHPMIFFEFINPIRIAYETYDLHHAVEKLVQTTLRSIIGDMGLDDTLASREEINRGIVQKISHVCLNWGIKICRGMCG